MPSTESSPYFIILFIFYFLNSILLAQIERYVTFVGLQTTLGRLRTCLREGQGEPCTSPCHARNRPIIELFPLLLLFFFFSI